MRIASLCSHHVGLAVFHYLLMASYSLGFVLQSSCRRLLLSPLATTRSVTSLSLPFLRMTDKIEGQESHPSEQAPTPGGTTNPQRRKRQARRRAKKKNAHNTTQEGEIHTQPADGGQSNDGTADSADPPTTKEPAWKRKNTPGLNSYLKVVLDDDTLNRLHNLTSQVKTEFEQQQQQSQNQREKLEDAVRNASSDSRNNNKRTLRIRPRSLKSLHMTFFFGGEVLCELPADELSEWHAALTQRFLRSGFLLQGSDPGGSTESEDFGFQLRELALFPPRRHNLIVAILDAAGGWDVLHHDIREIARNGDSEGLREITKRSKPKWTAHITLANLQGGNREQTKALGEYLKEFSTREFGTTDEVQRWPVAVHNMSMGGPMPTQVDLDWEFRHVGS